MFSRTYMSIKDENGFAYTFTNTDIAIVLDRSRSKAYTFGYGTGILGHNIETGVGLFGKTAASVPRREVRV